MASEEFSDMAVVLSARQFSKKCRVDFSVACVD